MSEINSRVWIDDGIYIKELQEENARLRDALEFYADEKHYDDDGVCGKLIRTPDTVNGPAEWDWEQDRGYVATEALKSPHDGKE